MSYASSSIESYSFFCSSLVALYSRCAWYRSLIQSMDSYTLLILLQYSSGYAAAYTSKAYAQSLNPLSCSCSMIYATCSISSALSMIRYTCSCIYGQAYGIAQAWSPSNGYASSYSSVSVSSLSDGLRYGMSNMIGSCCASIAYNRCYILALYSSAPCLASSCSCALICYDAWLEAYAMAMGNRAQAIPLAGWSMMSLGKTLLRDSIV